MYAERESRLLRCLLEQEKAMASLRQELFHIKEWIQLKPESLVIAYPPFRAQDLSQDDLEGIFQYCDLLTRYRLKRYNSFFPSID